MAIRVSQEHAAGTASPEQRREDILRLNLSRISVPQPADIEERISRWRQHGAIENAEPSTHSDHRKAIEPLIKDLTTRCRGPVLLEGVNPPWILEALLNAPAPQSYPFFRQRIVVLQADWSELLDGLSRSDLGEALGDKRIVWFVGEDAPERLLAWFDERIDDAPPSYVVQNPQLGTRATPDAPGLMREIEQRWTRNESQLIDRLRTRTPHDAGDIAQRVNDPGSCDGPLRVLIPVSRYTSYLQHIAGDLSSALRERGAQCEIVIERDDSTVISQCSIMRRIDELNPHLIVAINYTRRSLGAHVPKDIPHICWIQDAMEHLFDSEVGRSISALDMVVGMVKPELINQFNYPAHRTRWMPMVASRSKFSLNEPAARFDSEIAWITHQSEAPEIMRQRLLGEFQSQAPHLAPRIDQLFDDVEQSIRTCRHSLLHTRLRRMVDASFFADGVSEQAQPFRSHLMNGVVIPYAERYLRHQTAAWAGEIAMRHGWRFRLHGIGWEQHPTLAEFACNPLEHGDALREAYRRSAVQLHASINQVTHQRVSECILSGGLPLCRVVRDSFELMNMDIAARVRPDHMHSTPVHRDDPDFRWFVNYGEHESAATYVRELRRLGLTGPNEFVDGSVQWTAPKLEHCQRHMQNPLARENASMFASLTDLYFSTIEQFEQLVVRAVEDGQWRRDRISQAARTLPLAMTTEGFVDSLLSTVASMLGSSDPA